MSRSALLQEGSLDGTDCLVLRHTPRWPMSAVVSPPAADAYADVFSMLLRLKRVIFAMQHSWRLLVARGGGSGGGMDPARLRQLQLFRHEAEHFAVNLQVRVRWAHAVRTDYASRGCPHPLPRPPPSPPHTHHHHHHRTDIDLKSSARTRLGSRCVALLARL